MADEKLELLIRRLAARTQQNKVDWERTTRSGVFQAAFPDYSVQISRRASDGNPDAFDYFLRVFDQEGQMIEETSDMEFAAVRERFNAYKTLEDMYLLARKKALGVDKALDSLLEELGEE